jgi:hypothetical protein
MKPHLEITESGLASLQAFAESNRGPIVMVNLMQVRPNAKYEAPLVDNCTGYEALGRYTNDSAAVRQAAGQSWFGLARLFKCLLAQARKSGT